MTQDDFKAFGIAWGAAAEMQTGKELSDRAIKMAFAMLSDLTLDEVKNALRKHCRKTRWMPTPSDILGCVHGELPSNAELYGIAVEGDSVMGRFIAAKMGGDLMRLTTRDGVQRVEMIRSAVESFWQRALVGDYSDAELRMFMSSGLDPAGDLAQGISGPRAQYRAAVAERAAQYKPEPQLEQSDAERTPEQIETGKAALAELMKTLNTTTFDKEEEGEEES